MKKINDVIEEALVERGWSKDIERENLQTQYLYHPSMRGRWKLYEALDLQREWDDDGDDRSGL